MKNLDLITDSMVCRGQRYRVMRFTAETEAEKKFGERPWIAVHESYTDADLPLNGMQMLISRDFDELNTRVRLDAACRDFMKRNPSASTTDLVMFMISI